MILPFIISGLVTGSIYGLSAVGLVLTYKTSGLFNFAHGAIGTVAAYLFYTLLVQVGMDWPFAAAITILGLGPLLGLVFERLASTVASRSLALQVTSTVGILLGISATVILIYGQSLTRTVPVFLGTEQNKIGGTFVQTSSIVIFGFACLATAVLYVFFRRARLGAAMRGVVDNAELLELSGTSSTRVRRYAWVIGITFACTCGVLLAPLLPLNPILLTLVVVQAYGAAAIGAFRNLPLTFLGGLTIGVLASLATKYFTTGLLAGIPPSLPFIVLFVVLLTFPRKYLTEHSRVLPTARSTWTAPWQIQATGAVVVLAFLALVPTFAGIHIIDWTVGLTMVILFLSLGLLVRTAGQVSLCHVAFMAVGAAAFGQLTGSVGIPWAPALLISMLIAVPIGALLAIPAIRLSPLYLALATFGFGILLQNMFYTQDFMFGTASAGITLPRPDWLGFGSDTGFYYLVLILAVATSLGVMALNRSRLGRLLRGMADSPTAVATSGVSTQVTWVLVFCLSAALAAGAGALSGAAQQTATSTAFSPLLSLTYLALIVIVVGGAPWYAVIAGLALTIPPSYISGAETTYWLQVLFGVSAVLYAIMPDSSKGMPISWQRALDARFRRKATAAVPTEVVGAESADAVEPVSQGSLKIEDLSVRFGGLAAVNQVNMEVQTGRITGLIGPNGAGKTTTFNACSGLISPSSGRVELDGHRLTRSSPASRARRGLGRTFQQIQLFDSLTVWENVAMGAEGVIAGANPVRQVFTRRRDTRQVREATVRALELCELTDLAHAHAGSLSTGQRRLVELARCLAGPFQILLLDEPSSGLDKSETARFGEILKTVVAQRKVGILLVEHDMSLVMDVCEHIYVLEFGTLILEGTSKEVAESSVVRAAYLGDREAEQAVAKIRESEQPV